jgi:DNA mismatch repair protein MutL
MGPKDAVACFGRHATSKLKRFEDLERLRTLGFRGEALASIAAVAQVELRTRRASDAAGTCVRVHGGTLIDQAPTAAPPGTSIAVRNLFYNVPARRNFLKSAATEFKHLVETFSQLALSHPHVAFLLCHDGADVYRLPAPPDGASTEDALRLRAVALVGDRLDGQLVPVGESTSYLDMRGLVVQPEAARKSRGEGFFFVNGRYVKSRALDVAVQAAYGDALQRGQRPFYALFLDVDPRHVDCNVHPTKTEVKFDDERGVFGFVKAVCRKGLGEAQLVPGFAPQRRGDGGTVGSVLYARAAEQEAERRLRNVPPPAAPPGRAESPMGDPAPFRPDAFVPPPTSRLRLGGSRPVPDRPAAPDPPSEPESRPLAPPPAPADPGPAPLPETEHVVLASGANALSKKPPPLFGIGILGNDPGATVWALPDRYILSPVEGGGLLMFDQIAAHRRILYEHYQEALAGRQEAGVGSQRTLFPIVFEPPPADLALFDELRGTLGRLGFSYDVDGRSVQVVGFPKAMRESDVVPALEEAVEQVRHSGDPTALSVHDGLARSLARRFAYRPNHRLPDGEMRALIARLAQCDVPHVCPDGRQTVVRIGLDELKRRFAAS